MKLRDRPVRLPPGTSAFVGSFGNKRFGPCAELRTISPHPSKRGNLIIVEVSSEDDELPAHTVTDEVGTVFTISTDEAPGLVVRDPKTVVYEGRSVHDGGPNTNWMRVTFSTPALGPNVTIREWEA